ncbi:LOW QUALITY PROTEIN: hypothetical protein BRADI_1g02185v3 [Brachypodium distachyon]|uniref:KIB1-4 beta-propeller domain-containing protein n=1 Tax=Brachypodium distachyon TaxID=15368 RepID=A0A0Q3KM57_BRADI|nr:LOW QUALITY PROTEIN: hypothetical protein BRADI_1g02185v3 [Brachypodium distachyon]
MAPRTGAAVASPIITTTGSAAQLAPLEEELQNRSMCPTPHGWILVLDRDAAACLLDPHSRRRIPLPPLAIDPQLLPYCTCLLHPGDPSDPAGCLVLLVDPIATFLWHCRTGGGGGGGSEWTKQEYDIGTQGDAHFVEKRMIAPIAPCGGKFYFNPRPTETAVLELSHGGGPAPAFSSYDAEVPGGRAKVFLLESEPASSSLYMVKVLHSGGSYDEIKVYRMDFPGRRWCPVDDLGGGRAFFVGPMNFGASCAAGAGSGIQENCVYSLVAADDNSFRVFNLKDGTSELRNLDAHTLQTAERTISFWVLPMHQQLK